MAGREQNSVGHQFGLLIIAIVFGMAIVVGPPVIIWSSDLSPGMKTVVTAGVLLILYYSIRYVSRSGINIV